MASQKTRSAGRKSAPLQSKGCGTQAEVTDGAVYQERTWVLVCSPGRRAACYARAMRKDQRGLRFSFEARAEVVAQGSTEKQPARVMELSLRGCFLEISALPKETHRLRVMIWHGDQFFEAGAEVLYVRATGVGVVFNDMKPHCRGVLQNWILAALDNQVKLEHS
jgi:hypothetical protein